MKAVSLGDICDIKTGKLDVNAGSPSGEYPFFSCALTPSRISVYAYDCECVLIGGNGEFPVSYYKGKFNAYQRTYIVTPKQSRAKEVDVPYVYFLLKSAVLALKCQSQGSIIQYLRLPQLESLRIPFPDISEQIRIAALLAKADRLRRTRRYARQLSDTFLQSVFLEMFGDVDREPNRWEQLGFSEVCKISDNSVDPKASDYADLAQISSEDIESVSGELTKLRTARQKGVISVNFLVQPFEIIFSKIRPNLRKVAYPKIKALCSADIYPLRVIHPECDVYYTLFYLRGDSFSRVVSRIAESRSNIPKVNREELDALMIPVPPLPLQQKFADIVRRFERLRAQQREAERQAEHLFQTLLHRAFTSGL